MTEQSALCLSRRIRVFTCIGDLEIIENYILCNYTSILATHCADVQASVGLHSRKLACYWQLTLVLFLIPSFKTHTTHVPRMLAKSEPSNSFLIVLAPLGNQVRLVLYT